MGKVLLLALASALLVAVPASADTIPPLSNSAWTPSGAAEIFDPPKAISSLTPNEGAMAGSVLYRTAISPSHLTVSFDERMVCGEESCNGADGMAFDILNASGIGAPPPVGGDGGALGFYPNKGIAVTLTQNSVPWGCYVADHFIGIADSEPPTECPLHYLAEAEVPPFHNAFNHVVMELDWPTETINVSINGMPSLSYVLPPFLPLPPAVYIGFSAGTGNGAEEHVVENVTGTYTPLVGPPAPTPAPSPPWPAPEPAPAGCPTVAMYGVRGSGEDYEKKNLGMGPIVNKIASMLLAKLPSTYTVLTTGVPYRATEAWKAIYNNGGLGVEPYNDSVLEGAELLVLGRAKSHEVNGFGGIGSLVARCPDVKLVLIGHSQGAQVIQTALAQAHGRPRVTKRIRAILLYGNPIRVKNKPYDVGANARDGILADPDLQPGRVRAEIPNFLWPYTMSYCLTHDPICDPSPDNLSQQKNRDVHGSYAQSKFAAAGVAFAIHEIRNH